MDAIEIIGKNLSTWLVLFGIGALMWVLQQIAPQKWVKAVWWKKVMVAAPCVVGCLIAMIPPLNPVPGLMVHSAVVGFILGTMAQSAYQVLRKFLPKNAAALLGARAKRDWN